MATKLTITHTGIYQIKPGSILYHKNRGSHPGPLWSRLALYEPNQPNGPLGSSAKNPNDNKRSTITNQESSKHQKKKNPKMAQTESICSRVRLDPTRKATTRIPNSLLHPFNQKPT